MLAGVGFTEQDCWPCLDRAEQGQINILGLLLLKLKIYLVVIILGQLLEVEQQLIKLGVIDSKVI